MNSCSIDSPDILKEMRLWAKQNAVPLNVTFELTPLCNFNCVMCYVHLTPDQAKLQGEPLHANSWLEIARQARDMGTLNLTLTGGEPFLHPEFWEIYSGLNEMGFLITILSNGSLINEDCMNRFAQYGMPHAVKLTLYGASNETYRSVCGVPDGFTRIEKAVRLLKEAKVPLFMTSTIVRENACELQQIYSFARQNGIPMQHTISVVNSARGAVNTVERSRFATADFPEELSREMLERSKFPPTATPFAWCANYRSALWMTWNGHLQSCAFMNTPYVPWSGDLKQDWCSLLEELDSIRNPEECSDCKWQEFCQRCPGILCAESGNPEKSTPELCRMAERLYHLYQMKLHQEDQS
ncbi:MAG: radical SAM protein [Eubacteriales bacterium]